MKTTVEIPRTVLDAETKATIKALEARANRAEKRADSWRQKYKKVEAAMQKLQVDTREIHRLAELIGEATGMVEERGWW